LTSYISRLGWTHRTSTRALIAQEIVPHLHSDRFRRSPTRLGIFGRQGALSLNGVGAMVDEWVAIVAQLTGVAHLDRLTWDWWLHRLPSRRLLRATPAWCPRCYAAWRIAEQTLYQPLWWTLQCVTICPRHHCKLETHCPHCQKRQSVFGEYTAPGHCTQCNRWLGSTHEYPAPTPTHDPAVLSWHTWVLHALEELQTARTALAEHLPWERFFTHFSACLHHHGAYTTLARLTGNDRSLIYRWMRTTSIPAFEALLTLCYIGDVTPLHVLTNQVTSLTETLQRGTSPHAPRQPRSPGPVDHAQCWEFLQTVLAGHIAVRSMRQVARHLGCDANTIRYHFPEAYAVIVRRARAHRRQQQEDRLVQICAEVQQAVRIVHQQGELPSCKKVGALLSNPGVMRMPEARAAWREARRELGLDKQEGERVV
jgi:DNA-binding phage protein